jgi:hypothetical protein
VRLVARWTREEQGECGVCALHFWYSTTEVCVALRGSGSVYELCNVAFVLQCFAPYVQLGMMLALW